MRKKTTEYYFDSTIKTIIQATFEAVLTAVDMTLTDLKKKKMRFHLFFWFGLPKKNVFSHQCLRPELLAEPKNVKIR